MKRSVVLFVKGIFNMDNNINSLFGPRTTNKWMIL